MASCSYCGYAMKPTPDKERPDLGKKHDEVKERALMKKKMASRRFAELLLEVGKLEKL